MIGKYEIFPFHNSDSAIEILKKELPIDKFSQRYVLWTLQEHKELSRRFKELNKKLEMINIILDKKSEATIWDYQKTLDEIRGLATRTNQK